MNGICENGKVVPQEDFCEGQEQCPIATSSATALKSNCRHMSNNFCPMSQMSSKICLDKVNVSMGDYCKRFTDYIWICPMAKESPYFEQCYNE